MFQKINMFIVEGKLAYFHLGIYPVLVKQWGQSIL